jgi:hypothetical protein
MFTRETAVLAHNGGWDEMAFVLVPVLVFFVLQWVQRRKGAPEEVAAGDEANKLERRRRLAGGLVGEPPDPEAGKPGGSGPDRQDL